MDDSFWDDARSERFYQAPAVEFLSPAEQSGYGAVFHAHGRSVLRLIERLCELRPGGVSKVLDVGCNSGTHTGVLNALSSHVVGVDYSEPLLRSARTRHAGVTFVCADARNLPFENDEFGVVTCFGVVHCVVCWQDIIRECLRVTEVGGLLALQFHQARPAWQEICRGGLAVLLGRRTFARELARLKRVVPHPFRSRGRWLTRDGRAAADVSDFVTALGGQILDVHRPKTKVVLEGEYVTMVVLKEPR